jgi:hypothetical protein
MLSFFQDNNQKSESVQYPDWVSKNNASYKAYVEVKRLQSERLQYIERHNKKSHFKYKKSYHISIRRVADNIGVANTTLSQKSSYAEGFIDFLGIINTELERLKNERLKVTANRKSRGAIAFNKNELVEEVKLLKMENKKLKDVNVEAQVVLIIDKLSLPIKNALGL